MCPRALPGHTGGKKAGGNCGHRGDLEVLLGHLAVAPGPRAWKPLPGGTLRARSRSPLPANTASRRCCRMAGLWPLGRTVVHHRDRDC